MRDKRDAVEAELKSELERIFYARGIFVENVLLSEVGDITQYENIAKG